MFGSTANRFALPGSDIDVLILHPDVTQSHTYNLLYEAILQILLASKEFIEIEPIKSTTVPIIQARHKKTQISVDIVLEREDGMQGLILIRTLDFQYRELQTLYLVIKAFLVSKNVHKPWKGGIGSFVLINMITAFLQDEYKKKLLTTEDQPLHVLVLEFCRFIGFELRHKNVAISILQGGFFFDRNDSYLKVGDSKGVQTPMIVNPLSPFDDLGSLIRIFSNIIRPLFQTANNQLASFLANNNSCKIGDSQVSFIEQIIPNARSLRDNKLDV